MPPNFGWSGSEAAPNDCTQMGPPHSIFSGELFLYTATMGYSIIDLRPMLDPIVVTTDKQNPIEGKGFPRRRNLGIEFPLKSPGTPGEWEHISIANQDNVLT